MIRKFLFPIAALSAVSLSPVLAETAPLTLEEGETVIILGAGLGSRMEHYGHFETELIARYPELDLIIRNMADEGNTPGFRPHSGREADKQYAFPGAKELVKEEYQVNSAPKGFFETPDEWLTRLGADTILAFFGANSAFDGKYELPRFKNELDAFLKHTLSQQYNGESAPKLALVSPTAFQNLSKKFDLPDGTTENENFKLYTDAMKEVAAANDVLFIDLFDATLSWAENEEEDFTVDGIQLSDAGYKKLAPVLADAAFGSAEADESKREAIHDAVMVKNWFWHNDFKIPNGVHVFGRRYDPFGPDNYPHELKKTREMTAIRDQVTWAAAKGETFDVAAADAKTYTLPPVETNYSSENKKNGSTEYNEPSVSETKIIPAEGYKIELFAGEKEFPDLANPVQMSFDNKGRLWVATMASYPHWKIGDALPEDKLLIFEDTDNDGKADKQTVFAGDLHIPIGFEIAPEGVYVSQSGSLILLKDEDGDDSYDSREVIFSGFDDHDTHHAISAFSVDPSGAIMMSEGLFLHTSVETAYGPVRGTNGGFYRYAPQKKKLINYAQFNIPNPWGIAFDRYGQDFFLHTSGPSFTWMMPGSVKPIYGRRMPAPDILTSNQVRPTSGIEFVSSRHFPDEAQGDALINNNIGFLGAKQHKMLEDGTGFSTEYVQDLYVSEDLNFRPVDLEFAPDGSLYFVDWHNVLIGHMQHSARDPYRDHVHGRVYRVTYPDRPLVEPAEIDGASIATLLENLKLPEYRSRYRTRRELRGRDAAEVVPAVKKWVATQEDEHAKLEALWVTWGANDVDVELLNELLKSEDHKVRSAAVRVLRFNEDKVENQAELLLAAGSDAHGRVRLEAITAASWLDTEAGMKVLEATEAAGFESEYETTSHAFAVAALTGEPVKLKAAPKLKVPGYLTKQEKQHFREGAEIYEREGHCGTCHQANGKGLPDAGFPPIAGTKWAIGDEERLIKLTLNGLMGPIEIAGKKYPGQVPMTPFGGLLNDDQLASVLTFIRNSFGNKASAITPEKVAEVRAATKDKVGLYSPDELLKLHPLPTE